SETGWGSLNLLASIGAFIMGLGVLVFLANVIRSRKHGVLATANPWGADSLEWATSSPPPSYNFLHPPTVKGRNALWDQTPLAPVVIGLSTEKREVLTTTFLDAEPDHR